MTRKKIAASILEMNWKHAIVEILLIVIGILIAIQIDNWNEERKERIFEKKILTEIKIALEDDLENQLQTRLDRADRIKTSTKDILDFLHERTSYDDSLIYDFSKLNWVMVFEPKTSPFETLNSKGIEIVSNDELRLALLDMYDYDYPRASFFTDRFNSWTEENVSPILLRNFAFDEEGVGYVPINRIALEKDIEFRNLAIKKFDSANDLFGRYKRLQERAIKLIDLLEEETN